ncbi:hypothetical protein G4B88_011440 [Cannabis sativa]|uniref:Myb/SANT-like domain-containing protein n=1 Tax=Cannabis sativa TaxID=3483 RepID=A0A7J6GI17_CANSA|nr:hypothetical protein G4B88_011440 [Cannabis sativa]
MASSSPLQMTGTDSEVLEKLEEIFIELTEEEVLKGNRNTTTFTKQSWKRIKEELYAQAKRSLVKEIRTPNKTCGTYRLQSFDIFRFIVYDSIDSQILQKLCLLRTSTGCNHVNPEVSMATTSGSGLATGRMCFEGT